LNSLRQNVSGATLFQLGAELSWLFAAITLILRADGAPSVDGHNAALIAFLFAVIIVCLNGAFGLYRRSNALTTGAYVVRALLAPAIGIPLAVFFVQLLPVPAPLASEWWFAILLALLGLLLVRHVIVLPLEKLQEIVVSPARVIARGSTLEETVRQLGIDEVIVAVRQQRGGVLPLRSLLDCRLNGVQVTDLARYFERVHGQVPIESLKVSWLIYGHGFRQNALRAVVKRCFDLVVSAVLIVLTAPLVLLAVALIAAEGGGPVIYRQERVGHRGRSFTVLKLRSMAQDAEKDGKAAWASANDARITRVGRLIRRTRIDELPQLLNVLKGEMSFVGPRPERPEFVAMLTEQIPFYAVRHSVKPGLTGWAQVRYSYGATVEQSIRKLEYDLYYVKNHTLLLDLVILFETVRVVLLGEGAR